MNRAAIRRNLTTPIALGLACLSSSATVAQVNAQAVIPDGTLNTAVTQSGNTFTIDNGTTSGTNLFHSFREFSIPTGGSAIFNNATNIQNIFSRVTGGTISNIDGIIQANGSANLFLLNPNGILFGNNAQLNIGGAFIGTTAESLKFADHTEFSAKTPTPLLTMSAPVGLQMGQNPGAISLQNQGHSLASNDSFSPINYTKSATGLSVQPGQAIALIGGDIRLEGGMLTAEQGHLELASVKAGLVTLNLDSPNLAIDYRNTTNSGTIHLANSALLDTSGTRGGSITLQGEQIKITEGSLLFIQNQGDQTSGNIQINAASIELRGTNPTETIAAGLMTEAIAAGKGGDIQITATDLKTADGGVIYTRLFNSGRGGDITVQTTNSTELIGIQPSANVFDISVLSDSFGSGVAGNISLTSRKLIGIGGGYVGSAAFADGNAGNVTVNAEDIEFRGTDVAGSASGVGSVSLSRGDAGTLVVNTKRLQILDGAWVDNSSLAFGDGGNVIINASESILVSGRTPGFSVPSNIGASARISDLILQQAFRLPPVPTGKAGNVTVNTGELTVSNGATISVQNDGQDNAGTLSLNARSIFLTNEGIIAASTTSGQGGNILIQSNLLSLRQGSRIITTAGGQGNGGNITISAPIILGLEDSDIVANAARGRGGNIQITTQGIIGLQNRDRLTSENDITASSEFGVNGSVQVNNIGVDPNSGLVELATDLVDDNQQVAAGCAPNQNSSFVITGRGGVPQSPRDRTLPRLWADLRSLSTSTTAIAPASKSLIEATAWHRNPQTGNVELIAANSVVSNLSATCAIAPQE